MPSITEFKIAELTLVIIDLDIFSRCCYTYNLVQHNIPMLVESDTLFWGCRTGIQTEENGKFDLGNLDSISRQYNRQNRKCVNEFIGTLIYACIFSIQKISCNKSKVRKPFFFIACFLRKSENLDRKCSLHSPLIINETIRMNLVFFGASSSKIDILCLRRRLNRMTLCELIIH